MHLEKKLNDNSDQFMAFDFLKNIFRGADYEFEKITPEFLLRKKLEMGEEKYLRWLLKQMTICQSIISIRREENLPIQEMWLDKILLIEGERDQVQSGRN